MALTMTVSVMFNAYKASAVAVPAGYLAYLIEAVTEMLVGSGTCTQAQINDMNTSELFETAKGAAPNIDWGKNAQMKANVIENLNNFINDMRLSALNKSGLMENIVDWIYGNANTLAKINPELKGYGAMCFFQIMSEYSSSGIGSTYVYFGDYGIMNKGKYAEVYGRTRTEEKGKGWRRKPMPERCLFPRTGESVPCRRTDAPKLRRTGSHDKG